MKKYGVIVIMFLFVLNSAWAKLKNGYEKDIRDVREKLKNYNHILKTNDNLPASERRHLKTDIKNLIVYQSYYELTEELLKQFKQISPEIYNRIDSIKDAKGRYTDVYVKFIPRNEALIMAGGVTYMSQSAEDQHACISEYGKHSVSIKIWLFIEALPALAHELGHVNYQVANLATYSEYYKKLYLPFSTQSNHLGHAHNDRSGKDAITFQKEFKKAYLNQSRARGENARFESPFVLMEGIKKKVSNKQISVAL
jgi:hypothetical protein